MPIREEEPDYEQQLPTLQSVVSRQNLFTALALLGSGMLLLISFWALLEAYQVTQNTSSKNPTYRIKEITVSISAARQAAAAQYAEFVALMDEGTISDIDRRFDALYTAALGFEEDYRDFLFHYKQSIFQVAGRVGGSGVWHDFYTQRLDQFINNSRYQERSSGLRSQLHSKRAP